MFMDIEKVKRIKERYKPDMRVRLLQMDDAQAPEIGTIGTIILVDDAGIIHVKWENGSTLGVIFDAGDRIEVIKS
ncbi:MAG: DUF4314 domain-containing protein [Eubacteriales bacterium]|nr:DUF4314 domain-containing protein [Eubacteriales bacterium]